LGIRVLGGAFKMAPATGQSKINYTLRISTNLDKKVKSSYK